MRGGAVVLVVVVLGALIALIQGAVRSRPHEFAALRGGLAVVSLALVPTAPPLAVLLGAGLAVSGRVQRAMPLVPDRVPREWIEG